MICRQHYYLPRAGLLERGTDPEPAERGEFGSKCARYDTTAKYRKPKYIYAVKPSKAPEP